MDYFSQPAGQVWLPAWVTGMARESKLILLSDLVNILTAFLYWNMVSFIGIKIVFQLLREDAAKKIENQRLT